MPVWQYGKSTTRVITSIATVACNKRKIMTKHKKGDAIVDINGTCAVRYVRFAFTGTFLFIALQLKKHVSVTVVHSVTVYDIE